MSAAGVGVATKVDTGYFADFGTGSTGEYETYVEV